MGTKQLSDEDRLRALIREVVEDPPVSECAEDGTSCPFYHARWNQARAQFGDGVGLEHDTDCWIVRAQVLLK